VAVMIAPKRRSSSTSAPVKGSLLTVAAVDDVPAVWEAEAAPEPEPLAGKVEVAAAGVGLTPAALVAAGAAAEGLVVAAGPAAEPPCATSTTTTAPGPFALTALTRTVGLTASSLRPVMSQESGPGCAEVQKWLPV
jgi:hypothetical protein